MSIIHSRTPISMLALVATLLGAGASPALAAASEDDFKAAYAAAVEANKQAGQLRDQWTVTATALAGAKKAADAGDFDKALAESKEAEALARASVFQATSEKDAWKAMEIH
jgi:hypothetical protein